MTSGDETFAAPVADADVQDMSQEHGRYSLPSQISQLISVFGVQMRLYSKNKMTFVFVILALLIPILAYTGVAKTILDAFDMDESTAYLLALLPIMMSVIPPMLSGRILSSEFRNKTVFLTFPLPVSRTTFYFGKFLASLVMSISIFGLAYGLAIIAGSGLYEPSFPNDVLNSFLICIAGVFAIAGMAYGLSTIFKKGAIGLTVTLSIVLPFVLYIVLTAFFKDMSSATMDYIKLLPQFDGYQALHLIDAGFGGGFKDLFQAMMTDLSPYLYVGVALAWGALFLVFGMLNVIKKEL